MPCTPKNLPPIFTGGGVCLCYPIPASRHSRCRSRGICFFVQSAENNHSPGSHNMKKENYTSHTQIMTKTTMVLA